MKLYQQECVLIPAKAGISPTNTERTEVRQASLSGAEGFSVLLSFALRQAQCDHYFSHKNPMQKLCSEAGGDS